jgi:PAS domain S-box-containing protein
MTEKQFHPDDLTDLRRLAEASIRAGEALPEEPLSSADMKRLIHELRVHQIELEMQNEELRRTQNELEASRTRYFDLYDLAPVGHFTLSEHGIILEANLTAATLLGVARGNLLKQPLSHFTLSQDQDIYHKHRRQLFATHSPQVCELRMVREDSATFWVRLEATAPQDNENGTPVYRAVVSDITVQKRAEQSLKQQSESLQQANQRLEVASNKAEVASRSKSEFLANMSHEIRSPMTAILGFADILIEDNWGRSCVEHLQTIKRNGEHLMALINDILDLSKIEAGKCTIDPQKCSPSHIANEAITLMKVRADAKGLPLTLEVQGDLPERITTDPIRLRQILINLIGNSIKFTDVGGVRVVIRFDTNLDDESKLAFDVIDTGIGMSEEQMSLLFRPFSQVDGSASRRFGGTGLGLAISKRLAEMLGGDVVVRSSPGQGSTFSLSIATGNLDSVITDEPSNAATTREAVGNAQERLACRILLAEDGPDNQRLIAFLLRKAGAEVELAENGQIALNLALTARQAGTPFDMILMDMQMPVMDGYEATQSLRSAGYKEPIIALTAHAMTEDRQRCMDAGCDDYITKPIDPKKLIGLLEPWVAMEPSPV